MKAVTCLLRLLLSNGVQLWSKHNRQLSHQKPFEHFDVTYITPRCQFHFTVVITPPLHQHWTAITPFRWVTSHCHNTPKVTMPHCTPCWTLLIVTKRLLVPWLIPSPWDQEHCAPGSWSSRTRSRSSQSGHFKGVLQRALTSTLAISRREQKNFPVKNRVQWPWENMSESQHGPGGEDEVYQEEWSSTICFIHDADKNKTFSGNFHVLQHRGGAAESPSCCMGMIHRSGKGQFTFKPQPCSYWS